MKVTVKIDDKALFEKLQAQQKRARDMTPVMKGIAQDMMTRKDLSFKNQQDPNGKKWTPLADSTLRTRRTRKRKPTTSTQALLDNGVLRGSFGTKVTDRTAQIGTTLKYAATQQFGRVIRGIYKSGRRKGQSYEFTIPARRMVGFTQRQLAGYRRRINNWILKGEKTND